MSCTPALRLGRLLAAALTGLALAGPASALEIALLPTSSPGPSATLDVVVSGLGSGAAPSIGAFDLEIVFDSSALSVSSVTFGSELGDPATEAFAESIVSPGSVSLAEVSLLPSGDLDALQSSSVVLATLEVDLLGAGATAVSFGSVLLGDAFGSRLTPEAVSGATVGDAGGVVPEPSAALVFAAGLALAAARLRRRGGRVVAGLLLALLASLAAAPASWAGFPSLQNPNADQQAVLRFVCADAPGTQCLDQDADGVATGVECPAPAADPVCVPDFAAGEIRGTLTVLADDVSAESGPNDIRMTVLFDFKAAGRSFVLADTFLDQIGGWNVVFDENEVADYLFVGGTLFQGNLAPLGAQIQAIAQTELGVPADALPVVAEGVVETTSSLDASSVRKAPGRDASDPADGTASVARYRLTIRFVPPR
jgi:hypothetical protein